MYAQTGAQQPLIFYADDTQGGNTLAATSTRKSTLIYAAFLNFEFLHLEEMWMTLSVIKASDSETCHGGLAGVITALLSFYQEETAHGIPVQVGANYDLLFVPHVVFLSDHEGVRAAMGCKGAAGFKPCIKCRNCVPWPCDGLGIACGHLLRDVQGKVPQCPKMSRIAPNVLECSRMVPETVHVPECPKCPRMAPNVLECPTMSQNVKKAAECPRMSPECLGLKMSLSVPECPQNVPECPEMPRMSSNVLECDRMSQCPGMSQKVQVSRRK
eukprot:s463_g31.t1